MAAAAARYALTYVMTAIALQSLMRRLLKQQRARKANPMFPAIAAK